MGKRLALDEEMEHCWRATPVDGDLQATLEKLNVLHDAGACATELIGLAESGHYLIVKQPLCHAVGEIDDDRNRAAEAMLAVTPRHSLGREIRVFWLGGQAWCLGDLHPRNIMRDAAGQPTIIDALIGPLPPRVLRAAPRLLASVEKARARREGRPFATDDAFASVSDDAL